MEITRQMLDICDQALSLLRQDISLPMIEEANIDTRLEWVKCRKAFDWAANEVLDAHDWLAFRGSAAGRENVDLWPLNLRKALVYCLARELAVQIAGRTEDLSNWNALYGKLLVDAKLKDLAEERSDDQTVREVVATLRATFSSDAADLPRSMLLIYERVDAVRHSAFAEIFAAHNWQGRSTITRGEELPAQARAAWIALIEQKLAIVCGLSAEVAGSFEQLWRAKLREARVTDLETTPVPEGLAGEVLAQVRGVFSVQEDLPMDLASVVRRIETLVAPARREVLASHPWGCAQEEEIVSALRRSTPGGDGYAFEATLPGDALKLTGVWGRAGEVDAWKLFGRTVRATEPIHRLTYTRDLVDESEWTPEVRRLVVLRLAADLAKPISEKGAQTDFRERLYREALRDAKVSDARQSNPRARDVWGENYYVSRMRGEPRRR